MNKLFLIAVAALGLAVSSQAQVGVGVTATPLAITNLVSTNTTYTAPATAYFNLDYFDSIGLTVITTPSVTNCGGTAVYTFKWSADGTNYDSARTYTITQTMTANSVTPIVWATNWSVGSFRKLALTSVTINSASNSITPAVIGTLKPSRAAEYR